MLCIEFGLFHDFPDYKYKGRYHDYRSIIAKGTIKLIDGNDDYKIKKDIIYYPPAIIVKLSFWKVERRYSQYISE